MWVRAYSVYPAAKSRRRRPHFVSWSKQCPGASGFFRWSLDMTTAAHLDLGDFLHPALFYQSNQDYLDGLLPFITDGLEAGQPVLVAVPGPNLALLRDALGPAAADITRADMTDAGRNPGRILGGVLSAFADRHAPQSVRIIGEPIWPGRSEA